ncbi:MAG TPA: hypothetical protein GXZ91_05675 [Christensenellaceae bacterium]|nr:hypothetical protein [Christensenellaceae bacterium]
MKIGRKLIIFIISLVIFADVFCLMPFSVFASGSGNPPKTFEIEDIAEFYNAIEEINNDTTNDSYIISLKDDIDFPSAKFIDFKRGNTTLLGNGYEISNIYGFIVNTATLNLGNPDGTDTLKLNGEYPHAFMTPYAMLTINNGSVLNMYEGVEISNRNIGYTSSLGTVAQIHSGGTFNMEGGAIKDCYVEDNCVGPGWNGMVMVYGGTFNMSGGEISNNTVKDLTITPIGFPPGTMVLGGAISAASYDDKNGKVNGEVNITGGVISNNKIIVQDGRTGYGAAIFGIDSTIKIEGAKITGNSIDGTAGGKAYGGAICGWDSIININNSYITGNYASGGAAYGGGILTIDTDLTINNSLLAFNTADTSASDIYFQSSEGNKLYLPDKDIMNEKQTIPYTKTITGWYKDVSGNRWGINNPTEAFESIQNDTLSGECELVAGYRVPICITYNPNGGQGNIYNENDLVAPTIVKDHVSLNYFKDGYSFTGWNTNPDGTGIANAAGDSIFPYNNITLYAQWEFVPTPTPTAPPTPTPTPTASPTPTPTPTATPTPTLTPTLTPTPTPTPTSTPTATYRGYVNSQINVPIDGFVMLLNGNVKVNQFGFELLSSSGEIIASAKNNNSGIFVFPDRTFSLEVENYKFIVKQIIGADSSIIYDETIYTLLVSTIVENGTLKATVNILKDGIPYDGEIKFKNILVFPQTGDSTPSEIRLTFLGAILLMLLAMKKRGFLYKEN